MQENAYHQALASALAAGEKIFVMGGSALDAVEAAVVVLEDYEGFNAGKGAVFTHEGKHELDASIMDGKTLSAGAVCALTRIANPIRLAKAVMLHSSHVMLTGIGAEEFAKNYGFPLVDNDYFSTEFRRKQLENIRHTENTQLDHTPAKEEKFGTVGAVALDKEGNLAAATSTGGMTNKRYGRVGDTPIIGCGTYAENGVCAVSATGWGEFFIRGVVAYDVAAAMKYGGHSLRASADKVIMEKIPLLGGDGGIIAIDAQGNIVMPFNTEGMYRGFVTEGGQLNTFIYQ